jgi:hypothetical protein
VSDATSSAVLELVRDAADVYRDDPTASRALKGYALRLEEPLRVAVAGMVKAGKSTLLNAIIGEQIAPTDAGECTRIVTWYRYGDTPRVTLHPTVGKPRALSVARVDGQLTFDLGTTRAEDVKRLVVHWPVKSLREFTLIDTPGIASLSEDVSVRSTRFLTPETSPSGADAIVYVMRHLHAADLNFLRSFRDNTVGEAGTVNALAVLSRADEIGAGRIDSLLSARDIAERYRRDDSLRALALGVVPLAGLLAQSARDLRQTEFAALVELARLDRNERERLMISVDRFVRFTDVTTVSSEARVALLNRFGLFGIRLAMVLIRSGVTDSTALAHELARRSGLNELLNLVSAHFQGRAALLKSRAAIIGVEALLRARPRVGTERLAASLERIQANAHEFRELRMLATVRTSGLGLAASLAAEAERLIGGQGVTPQRRLGLADEAPDAQLRESAMTHLRRWRALAEDPLTDRATAEICHVVVRSCEALLAAHVKGSAGRVTARLVLGPEPPSRPGEHTHD